MKFTDAVYAPVTAGDIFQQALVRDPSLWHMILADHRMFDRMDFAGGEGVITLSNEEAKDFLSILRLKGVVCRHKLSDALFIHARGLDRRSRGDTTDAVHYAVRRRRYCDASA